MERGLKWNSCFFVLFFCLCFIGGCAKQHTDADNIEFIEKNIEEKYLVNFEYTGKGTNDSTGETQYIFVSDVMPDLQIPCYTYYSSSNGPIFIFPFESHRAWRTDLKECLQNRVFSSYGDCKFDVETMENEEIASILSSLLTKLNEDYNKFHIDIDKGVWITITRGNKEQNVDFNSSDQERIMQRLEHIDWR